MQCGVRQNDLSRILPNWYQRKSQSDSQMLDHLTKKKRRFVPMSDLHGCVDPWANGDTFHHLPDAHCSLVCFTTPFGLTAPWVTAFWVVLNPNRQHFVCTVAPPLRHCRLGHRNRLETITKLESGLIRRSTLDLPPRMVPDSNSDPA